MSDFNDLSDAETEAQWWRKALHAVKLKLMPPNTRKYPRFLFGPDDGNSGALIRWGRCKDCGIWYRGWKHRKLWTRWRFMNGYANFGLIVIRFERVGHLTKN